MKIPPMTIIVKEKTMRQKRHDEVTATLIFGVLSSVAGLTFLAVLLIKLMTR